MIVFGAVANVFDRRAVYVGHRRRPSVRSRLCGVLHASGRSLTMCPMPRASFSELLQASRAAVRGLGMPVIILGGIYGGVFTATEAAAVSVYTRPLSAS